MEQAAREGKTDNLKPSMAEHKDQESQFLLEQSD